jgi:RarD protein
VDKDRLKLIGAVTIFGTVGLVRKSIPYTSALVACVRGFIGAIFLLIILFLKKERLKDEGIKQNAALLFGSGIALGANWILLFEAYRYTSVSVATICYYMAPVIVIFISPFLFGEKITLKQVICSIVAVLGMVLVSGVVESGFSGIKGILLGLSAAVGYAAVITFNKKITGIAASHRTIIQLGVAAVGLFPYILLTEDFTNFQMELKPILLLLIAGILHTGVAYALYFGSIRHVPAQTVALLSYIDPIVAVLLSAFVLNETLTGLAVVGIVMVIGSAIINEVNFKTNTFSA